MSARRWYTGVGVGLLGLLILPSLFIPSCRSTAAPERPDAISLKLDAMPMLLKADSASTSTVWATVLESGHPVADSTLVAFAASQGEITSSSPTRDGLAQAVFAPRGQTGVVSIVAQVMAVRDTVQITVY